MTLFDDLKKIENIELYVIVGLFIFILWLIINTIRYYKGEKRKIKYLYRFAKEGEALSQYHLAQRYNQGNMIKKNCQNAAFWYQKAAFSGDQKAQNILENILKKKKC